MNDYPSPPKKIPTGNTLRALGFALLAKKEYSKTDLKQKLLAYGAAFDEVETLVEELAQQNYQSDERMAGMLLRSQIRQGRGPARIKQALKKHDIDLDLAQQEYDEVDWFEQALNLKIKKFGTEVITDPKQKAKQIRFLQYRGFSMDIIMKVVNYKGEEDFY
ncbi:MAG: recombination regulator RecX [Acinetobacter populi]|jgi:regulatory protein|uniref:regulatory protein RecX n=1 Tax=Acinetobacter populi TaxID=1582270 RepID=UPI002353FF53|nr:regulatory protein RecX [Acinetobacter populi]MCH4247758.1 recombination regulator RecX [Acinetobacter populi]